MTKQIHRMTSESKRFREIEFFLLLSSAAFSKCFLSFFSSRNTIIFLLNTKHRFRLPWICVEGGSGCDFCTHFCAFSICFIEFHGKRAEQNERENVKFQSFQLFFSVSAIWWKFPSFLLLGCSNANLQFHLPHPPCHRPRILWNVFLSFLLAFGTMRIFHKQEKEKWKIWISFKFSSCRISERKLMLLPAMPFFHFTDLRHVLITLKTTERCHRDEMCVKRKLKSWKWMRKKSNCPCCEPATF